MSNNRTFFKEVHAGKMTLKDIFSETLKKHTPEQTANVFIAGTPLTTPSEADMLAGWQKPFLFFRFLCWGIVTLAALFVSSYILGHHPAVIQLLILFPLLPSVTLLLLVWEMNIPRNISLYEILLYVAVGGALSILILIVIPVDIPDAIWAPLTEEPAKLLVIYLILRKKNYKYMINGILIGAAVGTGFAVMEDWQYTFMSAFGAGIEGGITQALVRVLTSIGGHGLYSGLCGGGLVLAMRQERVSLKHLTKPDFLVYFATACGLHALNNAGLDFHLPRFFGILKGEWVLIQVIAVAAFLPCLRKAVNQVVQIAAAQNEGRVTIAVQGGQAPVMPGGSLRLEALSGPMAGQVFRIPAGGALVLGRRPQNDICLEGARSVSGTHCRITAGNGGVLVTDLGSTNGTFIGENRLSPNQPTQAPVGAVIYMGSRDCGFRVMG